MTIQERLRTRDAGNYGFDPVKLEAADLIDALTAENAKLKDTLKETMQCQWMNAVARITELETENERYRLALEEIGERLEPPWTNYSVRQANRLARAALATTDTQEKK